MYSPIRTIRRKMSRAKGESLNILCSATHERYESMLAKTGHNFYGYTAVVTGTNNAAEGMKPWNSTFAQLPSNYKLIGSQIPLGIDFDLVLSQNKFGQFQILKHIARSGQIPMVSLEHTLPVPFWHKKTVQECRDMKGDIDVFISNFSMNAWNMTGEVVEHGLDTDLFTTGDSQREPVCMSVVNDWVNREWCQPKGQQILTKSGYKNIENIEIGDIVLTDNGEYNKVIKSFARPYNGNMVYFTLDNNNKLGFTPEHQIRVYRPNKNNQWCYIPSRRIKIGDKLRFPKHTQIDFTCNDIDFAWLIGLIIGDGHITKKGNIQINILKNNEKLINKVKILLEDITQNKVGIYTVLQSSEVVTVQCSSKIFGNWLRTKIYNENKIKLIPDFIMNSSQQIRLACISGLFEADGTFKNKKCARFVFSNTSNFLISQFSSILHSAGIKCSIREEKRDTNKKKNTSIYRAVGYGKINTTLLKEMLDLNKIKLNNFNIVPYMYTVTEVEVIDYDDMVYNCEVENNPSYVCYPGFVSHNCCNFSGWQRITQGLPVKVFGDTPGLSVPAESTDHLISEYQKSLIFVNTSTISPVPTSLLEAMSCGCAVVSTATCMIPEVIQDGVNGFISNDESVLRERIIQLLQNPELAKQIGQKARETVVNKFNITRFVNDWNNIFYKAANITVNGDYDV